MRDIEQMPSHIGGTERRVERMGVEAEAIKFRLGKIKEEMDAIEEILIDLPVKINNDYYRPAGEAITAIQLGDQIETRWIELDAEMKMLIEQLKARDEEEDLELIDHMYNSKMND